MNDERLEHLIHLHLDGGLSADEATELDALILSSPEARQRFWELARPHALLREWGAEHWGKESESDDATKIVALPKATAFPWSRWALGAAAVLAAGLILWPFLRPKTLVSTNELVPAPTAEMAVNATPAESASAKGVAVLTRATGVAWSPGQPVRPPGTVLAPGWLKLERGLVQIEFYSGAHVILEGPTEFEIVSEIEARCRFGKFSAQVPEQAHGFKVITPRITVTDLGTSFGCNVPREGEAEVQVLDGRILIDLPGTKTSEWKKGEAVRVNGERLERISFRPAGYVTPRELVEQSQTEGHRKHAAWKRAVAALDHDPATLVHYTFDDQPAWDGVLANRAAKADPGTQGGIVGANWTEGRWPGKGALEFKGAGDRVRLSVPGEHETLTCLAWLRVDGLANSANAILSAVQSGLGAADWDLTSEGSLAFRVRTATGKAATHFHGGVSEPLVKPVQMGRWMHLATIYDSKAGTISHYLDGQLVDTLTPKKVFPVTLAEMELGNWALSPNAAKWWPKSRPVPQRNFTGRVDELAIVARALSAAEIRRHYQAGQP